VQQHKEASAQTAGTNETRSDVKDYLAEERTFLAWIRTILGLMGLGFLLARFDGASFWLGPTLIVMGAALSLTAIQRHRRTVEALNHRQLAQQGQSREAIVLALFLAAAGVAMALYLILR
jgi:putative membrane protein